MAFRELYRPELANRPATLEAMLAHPTWRVALIAVARNRGRADSMAQGRRPPVMPHALPLPPDPLPPPPRPTRYAGITFQTPKPRDMKRAAANDLDDDE
jgi:hypothetical protein